MKIKLLFLLFLFILIPGISSAVETHTLDIEFAFSDPGNPEAQLKGYRLYKEGEPVCETDDPNAARITCDLLTDDGTFNFTLTALYVGENIGETESPPSPAFSYAIESTTVPPPDPLPQAIISAKPITGVAPLVVTFTGIDSIGDNLTYSWDLGDAATPTGADVSHTYYTPGQYVTTLKVIDKNGEDDQVFMTIIVEANTPVAEPPTAVLSSSATTGNAGLIVNFDGSSSTAPNSTITSYNWTFGDGPGATGETVSHKYTEVGVYTAELTVLNDQGLEDYASTPIIVTEAVTANKNPNAVISTYQAQSDDPLTISFDGSQSSDPDGSIENYHWNFGDGKTGNSQTVKHTYTRAAIYNVFLEVTDNQGATSEATKDVFFNVDSADNLNFEVGQITIDHQWVKVLYSEGNSFIDPVVIAGPPTSNEEQPVLIQIGSIDGEGFEVRLQEWDYQDDIHGPETFSYIVMEKGIHTLDSGTIIEAGSFTGTHDFQTILLQHQSYDLTPIILTQVEVVPEKQANAVTGRIQMSGLDSFEYKLQEMEKNKNAQPTETIHYIAWGQGKGTLPGILYEAGLTPKTVTHEWFDLVPQTTFPDLPLFIANLQTFGDRDTAAIRTQEILWPKTATQIKVKIEEEVSKDAETRHKKEVVGYLIIGSDILGNKVE